MAFAILLVFILGDAIWFAFSPLRLAPTVPAFAATSALTVLAAFVPLLVQWRVSGRTDVGAKFVSAVAERAAILLPATMMLFVLGVGAVFATYLSTAMAWPFQDGLFAAMDRAMGFDWPAFLKWTNDRPLLAKVLMLAYHSSGAQLVVAFLFLAYFKRGDRLWEFVTLFAVTTLVVNIGMTLFPAEGAYAYFKPDPATHSNYSVNAGRWHLAIVENLRGNDPVFDPKTATGIVTFPSFHTILAILTTYAVRGTMLFPPLLGLNILVIIGTIPEGGHHLVDVAIGALIADLAIVGWRRLCPAS